MTAFLTPFEFGAATRSGARLFRKRILPIGEIEYEGQRVRFDRPFLETLVTSFNQQAYDQVPFQLADAKNAHNNDPEKFRGEVAALELTDDGLIATVSTTEDGARLVEENPNLGISARIVNGLRRADGRTFKAAMQHVLATLDPMINGLGPWEAIEASNTEDPAINLTSFKFTEETVPEPQLSDEELAQLRALLTEEPAGDADFDADADLDAGDDGGELSEDELNDLIAAAEQFELGDEIDPEVVAASADPNTQAALELTGSRLDEQAMELARVTEQLADGRWQQERQMFMTQYGIPPAILDLAEPALRGDGHVFELSNGSVADAGAIVRRVLTEIGQNIKILDLSEELGTAMAVEADTEERDSRAAFVAQYRSETGI